jgi:hypothetical protein
MFHGEVPILICNINKAYGPLLEAGIYGIFDLLFSSLQGLQEGASE